MYGTELPDKGKAADDITQDMGKHHIYFRPNGTLQDPAAAIRARDMYNNAIHAFDAGNYTDAAKWTGAMTHYIDDLAVFSHIIANKTQEQENHASAYESYVGSRTTSADASWVTVSCGTLDSISPYDAAVNLAHDTAFGGAP
jgi:hypothetical protein